MTQPILDASIRFYAQDEKWTLVAEHGEVVGGWPVVPINGVRVDEWIVTGEQQQRILDNGVVEALVSLQAITLPGLRVQATIRNHPLSDVVRIRFSLQAMPGMLLTKIDGTDDFRYLSVELEPNSALTEIQLGQFEQIAQAFVPQRLPVDRADVAAGATFTGPMVIDDRDGSSVLLAYEHGAQIPDSYLHFTGSEGTRLNVQARRGNYLAGQTADGFESVWFDVAVGKSQNSILRSFREFIRTEMIVSPRSRAPLHFYNTWNYQERCRWYEDRTYIEVLDEARVLAEIDVAHRMRIDVYVVDTGWFRSAGDWAADAVRFPRGMGPISAKIAEKKMSLGLWFNPIVAAKGSEVVSQHPEWMMSLGGIPNEWGEIWGTQESVGMCLVSDYAQTFAEKLVQVHHETGATYFKWDAVGQYGCDSTLHGHGDASHTPQERMESYSYQMGLRLIQVAEYVNEHVPDAIVDFDITDGGRFVGLGFLTAGKYFLMNNGSFFKDFDLPADLVQIEPKALDNVFVHPGWARARVCRQSARWDWIVPSQAMLTHFLPEGDDRQQDLSLHSSFVAGGGMWGDILALSQHQIDRWGTGVAEFAQVREDVARAYPRYRGELGSDPEIYEKIHSSTGLVVFFAFRPGQYHWTTEPLIPDVRVVGADRIDVLPDGRLRIHVDLEAQSSRAVFLRPAPAGLNLPAVQDARRRRDWEAQ